MSRITQIFIIFWKMIFMIILSKDHKMNRYLNQQEPLKYYNTGWNTQINVFKNKKILSIVILCRVMISNTLCHKYYLYSIHLYACKRIVQSLSYRPYLIINFIKFNHISLILTRKMRMSLILLLRTHRIIQKNYIH